MGMDQRALPLTEVTCFWPRVSDNDPGFRTVRRRAASVERGRFLRPGVDRRSLAEDRNLALNQQSFRQSKVQRKRINSRAQVQTARGGVFVEPLAPESEAWSNSEASLLTSSALPINRASIARRSKSCFVGGTHDGPGGGFSVIVIGATKR